MNKVILTLIFALLMAGCSGTLSDPQQIVDRTIQMAGGNTYMNSTIEFDFRDRHYKATRQGGVFSYERIFRDSINTIHDYVTNDGFKREINGLLAVVPDSMQTRYASSTNSVIYFALLPYGLNDAAVQKEFAGMATVEGKQYYKVRVTFDQQGGGEDFSDVYFYWFDPKTFELAYLAYSFEEKDETSFRFRKALNPQVVGGIRFLDYVNYQPLDQSQTVDRADELFNAGKLNELSRIELKNISVK
ncbi:MAG: DUF6503 family protein [Cyclobacteriaceae bacterium]